MPIPPFVLSILTSGKFWVGLFIVTLLATLGVQSARLDNCKRDLAAAQAAQIDPATHRTWQSEVLADVTNLATARQNVATVTAALDAQGQAMAALKVQAAQDTAQAQAAVKAAHALAVTAQAQVAKIMAAKTGPDPCKSADALILGSIEPTGPPATPEPWETP